MTFRLTTLLYLFALLASSMAVLGPWGLLVGLIVFGLWAHRFSPAWQPREFAKSVFVIVVLLGLAGIVLYPATISVRTPDVRNSSLINLKQITLAILNYHDSTGHYPPPYATDQSGQPLYSWRALILPYIEGNAFHSSFRYDQPWDSLHNAQFLRYELEEFQSPRYTYPYSEEVPDIAETHYFAIVGDGTIWDPNQTVAASDVTDGLLNTMLLIEVQGTGIKWSEPRDFTLDEAIALLRGASDEEWIERGTFVSYRYDRPPQSYRCVAFADGRADSVYSGNNPDDLRAFLTRAGGEAQPELDESSAPDSQQYLGPIIHWGRIWGLAFWIAIILLPVYRRLPIFPARGEESRG